MDHWEVSVWRGKHINFPRVRRCSLKPVAMCVNYNSVKCKLWKSLLPILMSPSHVTHSNFPSSYWLPSLTMNAWLTPINSMWTSGVNYSSTYVFNQISPPSCCPSPSTLLKLWSTLLLHAMRGPSLCPMCTILWGKVQVWWKKRTWAYTALFLSRNPNCNVPWSEHQARLLPRLTVQ